MPAFLRHVAAIAALVAAPAMAAADPVADFYTGRNITIVVGSDAGGGYDQQAHLMAHHLGNFIPGRPTLSVQNMPGAGSINAANYMFNSAPKDGSFIALIQRTLLSANLTNQKGVRFDIQKFNWIGNLAIDLPLFVSWHTSPIKTINDLLQHEMVMGGGGPTSDSEVQARLLNAMIGTRIKVVSGYPGQAQIQLAMERGEVDAQGGISWSNLKSRTPQYITERKVNILIQGAKERAADLPDVPTPFEFVKNDADSKVLELFYSQQNVARPVLAPPETPADRLATLRKAFNDMIKSAPYLAEVEKLRLDASATPHESIESVIRFIAATPSSVAEKFATFNNAPN